MKLVCSRGRALFYGRSRRGRDSWSAELLRDARYATFAPALWGTIGPAAGALVERMFAGEREERAPADLAATPGLTGRAYVGEICVTSTS